MTNVESMDYTHSHPSIIASLYGTMHCPFSHRDLVQTCSDQTSNGPISVLRCHPWISNAYTTQYLKDL